MPTPLFSIRPWRRLLFGLSLLFLLACQPQKNPPSCSHDSDCLEPAAPLCRSSSCVAPPPACLQHSHCLDPARPLCKDGSCQPPPPECQTHIDCKTSARPVCKDGSCQPTPPECQNDGDCNDPARPRCLQGSCLPTKRACTHDGDCTEAARPVCLQSECQTRRPCQREEDCKEPTHPACLEKECHAACTTDTACPRSLPFCLGGRCQPRPPACTQDPDCKDAAQPVCKDGTCQALGPECRTDGDCKVVERPLCKQGLCEARQGGCYRDTDCSDPKSPRCRKGVCGPLCRDKADCSAPNAVCQQGQCSVCGDELECPAPLLCHREQCVASLPTTCKLDEDCKASGQVGAQCTEGRCHRLRHVSFSAHHSGNAGPEPYNYAYHTTHTFSNKAGEKLVVGTFDWWDAPLVPYGSTTCSFHRLDYLNNKLWEKGVLEGGYLGIGPTYGFRCAGRVLENGDSVLLAKGGQDGFEESAQPYGRNDVALQRVDPQGKPVWTRFLRWQAPKTHSLGCPSWTDRTYWNVSASGDVVIVVGEGIMHNYFDGVPYYFEIGRLRLPPLQKGKPFAVKFSPLGEVVWFRYLPLTVRGMDVDEQGNIYVGGSFTKETWNGLRLPSQGGQDVYVAKLDAKGELAWLTTGGTLADDCLLFNNPSFERTTSLSTDRKGRVAFRLGLSFGKGCYPDETLPRAKEIVLGGQKHPAPERVKTLEILAQVSSTGQWDWHRYVEDLLPSGSFLGLISSKGGSWFISIDDSTGYLTETQELSARGNRLWSSRQMRVFAQEEKHGWLTWGVLSSCFPDSQPPKAISWHNASFFPPADFCNLGIFLFTLDGFSGGLP